MNSLSLEQLSRLAHTARACSTELTGEIKSLEDVYSELITIAKVMDDQIKGTDDRKTQGEEEEVPNFTSPDRVMREKLKVLIEKNDMLQKKTAILHAAIVTVADTTAAIRQWSTGSSSASVDEAPPHLTQSDLPPKKRLLKSALPMKKREKFRAAFAIGNSFSSHTDGWTGSIVQVDKPLPTATVAALASQSPQVVQLSKTNMPGVTHGNEGELPKPSGWTGKLIPVQGATLDSSTIAALASLPLLMRHPNDTSPISAEKLIPTFRRLENSDGVAGASSPPQPPHNL